jgi:type I restriction enzyme, R subunit
MTKLAESHVEAATLAWLAELGYSTAHGPDLSPDGAAAERASYADVVLVGRLRAALARINPHLPAATLEEVVKKVQQTELPDLVQENRRLHRLLVEGVDVEVERAHGSLGGDKAWLVDFADPANNDWLAVNQFVVIEHGQLGTHGRRADVVVFVNGLSLGLLELKNPGAENATLAGAYNQLQTYKADIPSLFRTNAVLVTADGLCARIGSLTANLERFMPWRTVDGSAIAPKGAPELETLLKGVLAPGCLLALLRDFTVFGDTGDGVVKIVAGYHQFHAVEHARNSQTLKKIDPLQ